MLAQFSYTKMIIVVDTDNDPRNRDDIARALVTPMDYLDFASARAGLSGKVGIDATTKIGTEMSRTWGQVLRLDPAHEARPEALLARLISGHAA